MHPSSRIISMIPARWEGCDSLLMVGLPLHQNASPLPTPTTRAYVHLGIMIIVINHNHVLVY